MAVWFDVLTFPKTPESLSFYRQLEQWMYANYGSYASVRPEWSKGWAYSEQSAWSDPTILGTTIPGTFTVARAREDGWKWTLETFDRLDPHRVFTNAFLDLLMPPRRPRSRPVRWRSLAREPRCGPPAACNVLARRRV